MKEITAVIFDMDGVIFDSERIVIECWEVVAEKYGIFNVKEVCRLCTGTNKEESERRFLKYYGAGFPYRQYKQEMSELFHAQCAGGKLPLKPGVHDIMRELKEQKKRIALASSTRQVVVEEELKAASLYDYFDEVVCGDMVTHSKPHPEIFLEAAKRLCVQPEQCMVIEDSYNGIRAAFRAGMYPVMVPDLLPPTEEMQELARQICMSLYEVRDWFVDMVE